MGHIAALVAIGPRPATDPAASEATLQYLTRELAAHGYAIERESIADVTQQNLIATRRGLGAADRIIEIGAHYDTVRHSPGADDNASGVAAVLEIAQLIASAPTDLTLRVCLFAGEEVGLLGSAHHVRQIVTRADRVEAMVNFEMVGFASTAERSQRSPVHLPWLTLPSTGDFLVVAGTSSSAWLGRRCEASIDAYVPTLRYYSANHLGGWFADAARSDHASYWAADIPAIMLSDTADFRNPNYHRVTDRPDTLDPAFLTNVTRAGLATVIGLLEAR